MRHRRYGSLLGGAALVLAIASCSQPAPEPASTPESMPAPETHHIIGTVETYIARYVSVTYTTPTGTQQVNNLDAFSPPFRFEYDIPAGTSIVLVAQNLDPSGEVTCTLLRDGHQFSRNTSDGGGAVVTCEGTG